MLLLPTLALAAPPVDWIAGAATYAVQVEGDTVHVALRYHFEPVGGGFQDVRLVGPGLAIDVAPPNSTITPDGLHLQLGPGLPQDIVVEGRVVAPGHNLSLPILPATRQALDLDTPGLDTTVTGAVGTWLSPTDTLAVQWQPARTTPPIDQTRVHAELATAVWVADQGLAVHSVVRWDVVRGAASELRIGVAGLSEVEPSGAALGAWRREGDTLVLTPKAAVTGRFTVDLRARAPLPSGGAMPAPQPVAARVTPWWVLGKADEGELIPDGGERISRQELPPWARGLTETPQLAAWRGGAGPTLRHAKYDTADSVGTVVARARHQVVSNEDGRIFVRSTLRVRNERRQYLHVSAEPGFTPLGARVSGQPVSVLSDGAGGLYVPLEKSVETVRGLVSFPVELLWVAETTPFARRGTWQFTVPAVDAPVQRVEWDVHLPREVRAPKHDGAWVAPEAVAGQELALQALQEYRKNNFAEAQALLDDARALGGEDEDISALQSNLDVLGKKDNTEDATTRRVRDLANARNAQLAEEQTKAEADAEKAIQSGDYARAEELNRFVEKSAEKLAMTEQRESGEQTKKMEAAKQRSSVLKKKASEAAAYGSASASTAAPSSGATGYIDRWAPPAEPAPADKSPMPEATVTESYEVLGLVGGVIDEEERPMPITVDAPVQAPTPIADGARLEERDEIVARTTTVTTVAKDAKREGKGTGGRADAPKKEAPAAPPPAQPAKPAPIQLEAHASPFTLALPLDGERVTDTQDLLAPGERPTFTVRYRGTR